MCVGGGGRYGGGGGGRGMRKGDQGIKTQPYREWKFYLFCGYNMMAGSSRL